MLYRVRDGFDVFTDNPELLAIAEFRKLTDRQFRFVALVADRRSPLRTLPDREKRDKAARIAGYKLEVSGRRLEKDGRDVVLGKITSLEKGIEKYKEFQYDENQDTLDTIIAQIQEIKKYLKSDKSHAKDYGLALEKAAKLGERLPALVESRKKLEEILKISEDHKPEVLTYSSLDLEDTLDPNVNLSIIDRFMAQNDIQREI